MISPILEKLQQAQKLVDEAWKLALDEDILLYYQIHDFKNLDLNQATKDGEDNWDSSSFCAGYEQERSYY